MSEKKSGFWSEFKKFIMRGNVMDMAIGIIIGGAFTAIVNSLVSNVINPILGLFVGGINLEHLKIVLRSATETTPELVIAYGSFINAVINFLVIALVIFCFIRVANNAKEKAEDRKKAEEAKLAEEKAKAEAAKPAPEDPELVLLKEIRDLLKK